MKINLKLFILGLCMLSVSYAFAANRKITTHDEIIRLKRDVLSGRITVGKTRLRIIDERYGLPSNVTETEKKVTYNYGDLRVDFDKVKFFRDWEYDYSHPTAYSDDIESLRFDLEAKEIVGRYVTFADINKDYGDPTEDFSTD